MSGFIISFALRDPGRVERRGYASRTSLPNLTPFQVRVAGVRENRNGMAWGPAHRMLTFLQLHSDVGFDIAKMSAEYHNLPRYSVFVRDATDGGLQRIDFWKDEMKIEDAQDLGDACP